MTKSNRVAIKTLLYLSTITVIVFSLCAIIGIKVNTSKSMPLGLYILANKKTIQKGDTINFTVPLNSVTRAEFNKHPFKNKPKYFLKVIYGVAGDKIYIDGETVFVGNHQLRIREDIPSMLHPGTIPEGFVFVGTPHKYSFDSRYYGLIRLSTVTGTYTPLFTFGNS